MPWNGEIVERITKNQVVFFDALILEDKLTGIANGGLNGRIQRKTHRRVIGLQNRRINFSHIALGFGIFILHVTRECVSTSAKEQGGERRVFHIFLAG